MPEKVEKAQDMGKNKPSEQPQDVEKAEALEGARENDKAARDRLADRMQDERNQVLLPQFEKFVEGGKVNTELLREHAAKIAVSTLLKIERAHEGTLLNLFGKKEGDDWKIDFLQNARARVQIGAGDILPPTVRAITTVDPDGDVRTSGDRRGARGDFFDDHGYMEILDGYTLKIANSSEQKSAPLYTKEDLRTDAVDAYARTLGAPRLQNFDSAPEKSHRELITEAAIDHGVDPALLFALHALHVHKDPEMPFGIENGPDVAGFEGQLNWALRIIGENEYLFERMTDKKAREGKTYTKAFLVYFSSRYDDQNLSWQKLFEEYERFGGRAPAGSFRDVHEIDTAAKNVAPKQLQEKYRNFASLDLPGIRSRLSSRIDSAEMGKSYGERGCSRFVSDVLGLDRPISSAEKLFSTLVHTGGQIVESPHELQRGDVVFFSNTYRPGPITHTGIMRDPLTMLHHGTFAKGAENAYIKSTYYKQHFYRAVRLPQELAV